MNFNHLDLNLLIALDALLTERNITEAGRRVHLTQSAMSGSLARLREFFNDELLEQVGRKMVPTPLATSLAEPVRDILFRIKSTIAIQPNFDPATSRRRFSLMMSDYVATVLMPRVLESAEKVAPHVGFEILSNDVINPWEGLDRADIDFLIMPPDYLQETHPRELLFDDPYTCIVSKDNSLVGDSISREQYLELAHVAVQFGRGRYPAVEEYLLNQLGLKRRVEVVTMNFNMVAQHLLGTQRIAMVPTTLAEHFARYLPVRIVPAPFAIAPLRESLQWPKCFDADPGSIWLRSMIKQVASGQGGR
jgi:DNA-binding transcriptional LysR family regulator